MEEIKYTNLDKALWEYGYEVADRYRNALTSRGIDASGKLGRTAHPVVKDTVTHHTLYLSLQDYWKYVEYGTRTAIGHRQGNRPPVGPFVDWIRAKGIPFKGKSPLSLAYAVSWKVWKTGTLPKNVLGQATYDADSAEERMERAAAEDIRIWTEEMMEELTR